MEKGGQRGFIEGWTLSTDLSGSNDADIDLDSFDSVQGLVALGGDRLRAVLIHRGLKAGGTAPERAKRLWSVKGLSYEDVPKKLKAKQAVLPSSSENKPSHPRSRQ